MSDYSIRPNDNLTETLSAMFPQCKSIRNFNLARTESMYAVNHGIGPFFKSLLYGKLKRSVFHVYCFDESLAEVTQTCEMDLYITYSVCFLTLNVPCITESCIEIKNQVKFLFSHLFVVPWKVL